MKLSSLLITIFCSVLSLSCMAVNELSVHELGVTFSGDHATGSPTLEVLTADVTTASKNFIYIRTYTTMHAGGRLDLLKIVEKVPNLKILIGVPLDSTTDAHLNLIRNDINASPTFKARITGILIGNETGSWTADKIKTYVDKAHQMFPGIPISSAQDWNFWVQDFNNPQGVTSKIDFIAINLYPNWCWFVSGADKQPIENCGDTRTAYTPEKAAASIADGYKYLQSLNRYFPKKKMVVTETGWPTSYGPYGTPDPIIGNVNTKKYIALINTWAVANKINVYMYSLFDDIYADPGTLFSTHFGFYNSQGKLKFNLGKYYR